MTVSTVLVACALGVGLSIIACVLAVRRQSPPASVYAWLGVALLLFWTQVTLIVLWLAGVLPT